MCMVLYGYDASVFNSVQASTNWLAYFNLDAVSIHTLYSLDYRGDRPAKRLAKSTDSYELGLINTAYTIGAIVAGFFFGGPTVSNECHLAKDHWTRFLMILFAF